MAQLTTAGTIGSHSPEVPRASALLTIASPPQIGDFMRKVTEWVHGRLASGREPDEHPPGIVAPSLSFDNTFSVCSNHRLLVVTDGRERAIGPEDRPMHDPRDKAAAATLFVGSTAEPGPRTSTSVPEQGSPRLPFAEDGVFIVDADSGRVLEAVPLARQGDAERINGDVVHNTDSHLQMEALRKSVRDMTPHMRRFHRARRRLKALAAANRHKDEFLATLSHELRSPLSAFQYALHLLSIEAGGASAHQGPLAQIERQVRRMTRLVDDLVQVSWINHGRLRLRRERMDLRVVVNNAIETLQPDIKERNHHLSVALPDSPVWLHADSWRLEQVFANLLVNASKYTDAGGELAVWMHTRETEVVVRIRDSGIGIAPGALPRIFELFRQTDEADQRSRSGLGIGLAVVRQLVETHGGTVLATSAGPGKGSEFTVRLPRLSEATPDSQSHRL
jgi:signal transduction histidine kinase